MTHEELEYALECAIKGAVRYDDDGNVDDAATADAFAAALADDNIKLHPVTFDAAVSLLHRKRSQALCGRVWTSVNVVSFWRKLDEVLPYLNAVKSVLTALGLDPSKTRVEYWVDEDNEGYELTPTSPRLLTKWDDGRNAARKDRISILVPLDGLAEFVRDAKTELDRAGQAGLDARRARHLVAARGVSNAVVPGWGSTAQAALANRAGFDTVAAMHAARPEESARQAVRTILGETDLPKHWGDLPGYGQAITDPKRVPPYAENFGDGITHIVTADGSEFWYRNGLRHRDGDLPAITKANGDQHWYRNGLEHRDGDKPAVVNADGIQVWYQNGVVHRRGDKPAFTRPDGYQAWWFYGKRHRGGGQPAVVYPSGTKEWWTNGNYDGVVTNDPEV